METFDRCFRVNECQMAWSEGWRSCPTGASWPAQATTPRCACGDLTTGRPVATLSGHTGRVTAVAFSPGGRRLASASNDSTVCLWDPATGRPVATLDGHTRGVIAVEFSPDGRQLASASPDGPLRLWDPATPISSPLPLRPSCKGGSATPRR
jgi:WD40 repeat protein